MKRNRPSVEIESFSLFVLFLFYRLSLSYEFVLSLFRSLSLSLSFPFQSLPVAVFSLFLTSHRWTLIMIFLNQFFFPFTLTFLIFGLRICMYFRWAWKNEVKSKGTNENQLFELNVTEFWLNSSRNWELIQLKINIRLKSTVFLWRIILFSIFSICAS